MVPCLFITCTLLSCLDCRLTFHIRKRVAGLWRRVIGTHTGILKQTKVDRKINFDRYRTNWLGVFIKYYVYIWVLMADCYILLEFSSCVFPEMFSVLYTNLIEPVKNHFPINFYLLPFVIRESCAHITWVNLLVFKLYLSFHHKIISQWCTWLKTGVSRTCKSGLLPVFA